MNRRSVRHLVQLLGGVFLTGCPQLLSDEFRIFDSRGASSGGTGGNETAGAGGSVAGTRSVGGANPGGAGVGGAGGTTSSVTVRPDAGATYVVPDATVAADAGTVSPPPPPCVGDFGSPVQLAIPGVSGSLYGAWPFDNVLLFSMFGGGEEAIYSATRSSGNSYLAPSLVPNIDTGNLEGGPSLSANGRELYFFSDREGGDRNIWHASRSSVGDNFQLPTVVANVSSSSLEGSPRLSEDGLRLRFVSGRDSTFGSSNLWESTRDRLSDDFSEASVIPGLNTNSREEGATYSADDLTVYFSSDRSDNSMNVWRGTRTSPTDNFTSLELVSSVSSNDEDLDLALSHDSLELYLTSDRGGSFRVWRAAWVCD